jgi:hypothetical protein
MPVLPRAAWLLFLCFGTSTAFSGTPSLHTVGNPIFPARWHQCRGCGRPSRVQHSRTAVCSESSRARWMGAYMHAAPASQSFVALRVAGSALVPGKGSYTPLREPSIGLGPRCRRSANGLSHRMNLFELGETLNPFASRTDMVASPVPASQTKPPAHQPADLQLPIR